MRTCESISLNLKRSSLFSVKQGMFWYRKTEESRRKTIKIGRLG